MDIGRAMLEIREEMHLSRKELASKLSVTPGALWKMETGKVQPKQATIQRFLETTGVGRAELYLRAIDKDDIPARDFLDIMDVLTSVTSILYRHRRYD